MTNVTGRLGLVSMLLGLVAGCGSSPLDAADSSKPAQQDTVGQFIPAIESADDPGYCGYRVLAVDASGKSEIEVERYFYPVINRLLAEDAELRDYTGLSTVSSCDDARKFIEANNAFQEAQPAGTADAADLLADFPIMPPESPKRDPNAITAKILSEFTDEMAEVLQFGYEKGTRTMACTAIRLSGALFLTAAHCLTTVDRAAMGNHMISFESAWIKHLVPNDDGTGELYDTDPSWCTNGTDCHVLQLDGYQNPNYAGTNDYRNDLAVVHVRIDSQKYMRTVANAVQDFKYNVGYLATRTPKMGDIVEAFGWGPYGNFDMPPPPSPPIPPTQYYMRRTVKLPIATADTFKPSIKKEVYAGTAISTKAAVNAQLCRGDSGGPHYDEYRHVVSVNSKVSFDTVQKACSKIGTSQYSSRVDYQAISFIPRAIVELQQGSDYPKCKCVFFPASGDPTGKDMEQPSAHIRCNVGCEDPAKASE